MAPYKKSEMILLLYRAPHDFSESIEKVFDVLIQSDPEMFVKYQVKGLGLIGFIKTAIAILFRREHKIHITGDVHYYSLLSLLGKTVTCTIHDINHFDSLSGIRRYGYFVIWILIPLIFSKRVYTISPHVNQKLRVICRKCFLNTDIRVIPNPVVLAGYSRYVKPLRDRRYDIIQVGTAPHKRHRLAVQMAREVGLSIAVVGPLTSPEREKLEAYDSAHLFCDLEDSELIALYQDSKSLLFLSDHEGFGLPIIEAQTAGCFVVTSTREPMSWVVGDGGVCVDPNNLAEVKATLEGLSPVTKNVEEIANRGKQNVDRFSRSQFISAYNEALIND